MGKLLDLKNIGLEDKKAGNSLKLHRLFASYAEYSRLLLKAKNEYEGNEEIIYLEDDCYYDQIDALFSQFEKDECLKLELLGSWKTYEKDMLFLLDKKTMLRLHNYITKDYEHAGINYSLVNIKDCVGKVYTDKVYHGDPYYADYHTEVEEAFGLFTKGNLITPNYKLTKTLKTYDNVDIRDILKPQSIDEIYEKITQAKDKKVRKLNLHK